MFSWSYYLGFFTATLAMAAVWIGGYHYGFIHDFPGGPTCISSPAEIQLVFPKPKWQ